MVAAIGLLAVGAVAMSEFLPSRPDDGIVPSQFPAADFDVGEIPGRLGSPIVYRRGGRVVFWDTFGCGLAAWEGAGSLSVIDRSAAWIPPASLKLIPTATTPGTVEVQKRLPYVVVSPMGFEVLFTLADIDNTLRFKVQISDGANQDRYEARVQLTGATTATLDLLNSGSTWTKVADLGGGWAGQFQWHDFKLVIDPVAGLYHRVMIDDRRFSRADFGNIAPVDAGAVSLRSVTWVIVIDDASADQDIGRIGAAIATIDEP